MSQKSFVGVNVRKLRSHYYLIKIKPDIFHPCIHQNTITHHKGNKLVPLYLLCQVSDEYWPFNEQLFLPPGD